MTNWRDFKLDPPSPDAGTIDLVLSYPDFRPGLPRSLTRKTDVSWFEDGWGFFDINTDEIVNLSSPDRASHILFWTEAPDLSDLPVDAS